MSEYIKRDALMTARREAIRVYENANIYNAWAIRAGLKPLLDAIVDVPAADVAPVVCGEWGNAYYDEEEREIVRDCSVCDHPHRELSSYCPNCGATMKV